MRQNTASPSGKDRAGTVTIDPGGPPDPLSAETARHARGRLERPALGGRLRSGPHREPPRQAAARPAIVRSHLLFVTGELGGDSAVAFEAEVDMLCASGIDELVLDLSGLRVDATGARVLALRCELCRRRGIQIQLAGVEAGVREAFLAAGVEDQLRPAAGENPPKKGRNFVEMA